MAIACNRPELLADELTGNPTPRHRWHHAPARLNRPHGHVTVVMATHDATIVNQMRASSNFEAGDAIRD